MKKKLMLITMLSILSLIVLTNQSKADQKRYKNIQISESILGLVDTNNKEVYIPITVPLQQTFEVCGAKYKFKAEGFYFLHYEDVNDKEKIFDASKCSEVITENTFTKVEPELLKDKTVYSKEMNKLNTELADISNALKGARKYKIIKKGAYGRAYLDENQNVKGIYIQDDVYGRKVFAMPTNDIEKMEKYKESVLKYKEWTKNFDEYTKRQQEIDKIEEQNETKKQKEEDKTDSKPATSK